MVFHLDKCIGCHTCSIACKNVWTDRKGAEYLLGLSPGVSRSIFTFGDKRPALSNAIADKHGIWFGSLDGIYLYTQVHGLVKVSNQPGYPANGCI